MLYYEVIHYIGSLTMKYVITCLQNATPVYLPLLNSLIEYSRRNSAKLVVLPSRYRNVDSNYELDETYYDEAVMPYLVTNRFTIANQITVLSDVAINATAVNPLSGLEPLSQGKSLIAAHPQVALKLIATNGTNHPFTMATTGSLNLPNYSKSKAGSVGEFHHTLGAVLVDVDDEGFDIRHLPVNLDGYIIDKGLVYGKSVEELPIEALVMGDLHFGETDSVVLLRTLKLIKEHNIGKVVLHDCFDGSSINPHEATNPFIKYTRRFNSLNDELKGNYQFLSTLSRLCREVIVVDSNHNDFLNRWVLRTDYRTLDVPTAQTLLKLTHFLVANPNGDSFKYYMQEVEQLASNVKFLSCIEQELVEGILVSEHGHRGANGSRGSLKQFSKLTHKTVTGHTHTPAIEKGAYSVGTSTILRMGYNKGLSNWFNTHCIIHKGGKRQLINMIRQKHE